MVGENRASPTLYSFDLTVGEAGRLQETASMFVPRHGIHKGHTLRRLG